jgi:hypothetical protein
MADHSLNRTGFNPDGILLERSDFQVRLANDPVQNKSCSVLINRMYAWRGYKSTAADPSAGADEVTLQACRGGQVFGTVTLCFDSGAGLAADGLYREEINDFRAAGGRVCELKRLAVDPEHGSKELLGALFHLVYVHGTLLRRVTDVFIEVNPRHVRFYQRMLHFRQAGDRKFCERVSAIAVLLHLEAAYVREQIARCGGQVNNGHGSLYPYFFSPEEDRGLAARVLRQQPKIRTPDVVTIVPIRAIASKDTLVSVQQFS